MIVAAAYLLGGIPTGLWLGRRVGIDVRASGSGNIGATNVARAAGLRLGVVTLVIDVAKGALPVWIARQVGLSPAAAAATAVAAVVGHIFPVFARFRGGKGVATAAGAFAVLSPVAWVGAVLVFAAVAYRWRIASLASLAAAVTLVAGAFVVGSPDAIRLATVVALLILLATHRSNLARMFDGTEPRFRARTDRA